MRKHFVDERIRTLFTSYMHVITTENVPGAGIVFPTIFANIASFTLPAGGAASLPLALARVVEAGGGKIVTGCDVKEINLTNGRATGVTLADGRLVHGRKFVASAIDFPTTLQMTGEELFPEPVREKAKSWHWGNHSLVTLHLALRHPPAYRAADFHPDVSRAYNIFFGMDDIDDVASCFEDCAAKKFPKILMGNGACNSQFDPSYAPADRHGSVGAASTPSAFLIIGGSMPRISRATICSEAIFLARSTSNSRMRTCGRAPCASAPIFRASLASIGHIR